MANYSASKTQRIHALVKEIHHHNHLYYNLNDPELSDAEYDKLYDELAALEAESGVVLSNSPTQRVGAPVVSALSTVQHEVPLLSLDKTKDVAEVVKFSSVRKVLVMLKLDGLTVKLEYDNGGLLRASTRGDGNEGEDITHNARVFTNVPLKIPYPGKLVVIGEAHILADDFKELQATTAGKDGKAYKNARNLAAGSSRLLDAGECAKRRIRFGAFNMQFPQGEKFAWSGAVSIDENSKVSRLNFIKEMGFSVAHHQLEESNLTSENMQAIADDMRKYAETNGIPIDGLVITYDDVEYSQSLGRTGHHYRDGIAFKFEDEMAETVLREVEWNVTRSGEVVPVAIFDTVELDNTEVSRASLHNLTFIRKLGLKIGDRIMVSKRNMIIPHIEENLDINTEMTSRAQEVERGICPCCYSELSTVSTAKGEESLFCVFEGCSDRKLRQFEHFGSRKAMNIIGLSESTLKKFMDFGLLEEKADLYTLNTAVDIKTMRKKRDIIVEMDGFGEKAFKKLIDAIETSRTTTIERFLIAMDIPNLGRHASAILCKVFNHDIEKIRVAAEGDFDFTTLQDFGDVLHESIRAWFRDESNLRVWETVLSNVTFKTQQSTAALVAEDNPFKGKTVVATGSFETFTRESINTLIEALGAKASGSVSKKTNFLVAGEKAGSKKEKAESLGVTVLSESEFRTMAGLQ